MRQKGNSLISSIMIKALNKNYEKTQNTLDTILGNNHQIEIIKELKDPNTNYKNIKELLAEDVGSWMGEKAGNYLGKQLEKKTFYKHYQRPYESFYKAFKDTKDSNQLLRINKKELKKISQLSKKLITRPLDTLKRIDRRLFPKVSKKLVSGVEKKLIFKVFKTPIGKIAGPAGIILENVGGLLIPNLIKNKGKLVMDNQAIHEAKIAAGSTIGGLIGFGLGTAIAGPVGGIILSSIGSAFGGFIAGKLTKQNYMYDSIDPKMQFLKPKYAAVGIPRVPYDNFPALLHEGESVLTKSETNNRQNGIGSVSIAKLSDTIIVREESDIDKIAVALVSRIRQVSFNMA